MSNNFHSAPSPSARARPRFRVLMSSAPGLYIHTDAVRLLTWSLVRALLATLGFTLAGPRQVLIPRLSGRGSFLSQWSSRWSMLCWLNVMAGILRDPIAARKRRLLRASDTSRQRGRLDGHSRLRLPLDGEYPCHGRLAHAMRLDNHARQRFLCRLRSVSIRNLAVPGATTPVSPGGATAGGPLMADLPSTFLQVYAKPGESACDASLSYDL
jgi:hypothetical protein